VISILAKVNKKFILFIKQKPPLTLIPVFIYSYLVQFIFSILNKPAAKFSYSFKEKIKKGKFNNESFDQKISFFLIVLFISKLFLILKPNNYLRALELGSWEGRSSIFISSKFNKIKLICVDNWGVADERTGKKELKEIYSNFLINIVQDLDSKIFPMKSSTIDFFDKLDKKNRYDFIYVSASNKFNNAYLDLANSINFASKFSLIIFDDYLRNYYQDPSLGPGYGLNLFFKKYKGRKLIPLFVSHQVLILVI